MIARRSQIALLLIAVPGCGGTGTLSQRLAGEWRGRPESAAERTLREWPGETQGEADDRAAEPTELEAVDGLWVWLDLAAGGKASMRLEGREGADLEGEWTAEPGEGRRALLEIAVDRTAIGKPASDPDAGNNLTAAAVPAPAVERRRFSVQLLPGGDRFVLNEEGADQRFGRLLFARVGSEAEAAGDLTQQANLSVRPGS